MEVRQDGRRLAQLGVGRRVGTEEQRVCIGPFMRFGCQEGGCQEKGGPKEEGGPQASPESGSPKAGSASSRPEGGDPQEGRPEARQEEERPAALGSRWGQSLKGRILRPCLVVVTSEERFSRPAAR